MKPKEYLLDFTPSTYYILEDEGLLGHVSAIFWDYHIFECRKQGYAYIDGQLFPIGSKLAAKENGELYIAPPDTPKELIIGTVE
jgi:hypothetical protein